MLQLCNLIGSSEFQLAYPYIYICNLMSKNHTFLTFFQIFFKLAVTNKFILHSEIFNDLDRFFKLQGRVLKSSSVRYLGVIH